ncbi:MAG TPA: energy-coupling factor transporter transmembrane component T, partial [Candidatus Limnocylindrales bacterium]|nr:energy-coupling factor transporter transmembrane component T [Candidatus Limnocylindrales bacterium]
LGRTSPVLKLAIAVAWLVGMAFSVDPRPPLLVVAAAGIAAVALGAVPPGRFVLAVAPLWLAALGITLLNTLFSPANGDPAALELVRVGPLRVTQPALEAGIAVGLRVFAIAGVGVAFAQTTDATRLVDSLVQQVGVSERFAYGALAAYQAIPRFGEDLTTLRQARRIRGLGAGWHPRIVVGLLVLAIRHGDALALAMDARAFGTGPRTRYRQVRWTALDAAVGTAALIVLVVAVALPLVA